MVMSHEVSTTYLKRLLGLLDDPSETVGTGAMAGLLQHEAELLPLLAELQEADNPLLRKRVHQLQAILTVRERRRRFLSLLQSRRVDLLEGMVEVHLLWFDNDSRPALFELFQSFLDVASNNRIKTIEDLGSFMLRSGFNVPPAGELTDPENYCIGTILEDRIGADIMLCVIALLVGAEAGLELGLVRVMGNFAVLNVAGVMICPTNDWAVDRASKLKNGDFWNDPAAILKYASLMLFLYAVGSDSFRYIHTIGHSLSGVDEQSGLDFLPYPYGGEKPSGEASPPETAADAGHDDPRQ